MKLLLVIDSLGRGGAEQALLNTVFSLQDKGYKVSVAALKAPYDLAGELKSKGITVYPLHLNQKWNFLRNCWCIRTLVKNNNYQLIHSHLYFSGIYIGLLLFLGLLANVKTVHSFHNLAYAEGCNPKNLGFYVRKVLNRFFLHFIHVHTAVSHASAIHYRHHLGLENIAVIHNPITIDFSLLSHKKPKLFADNTKEVIEILLPGRLVHEKNHIAALKALAFLKNSVNFKLTIAGDGPLRKYLEEQLDTLGLRHLSQFTGSVEHNQLLRLIQDSDLCICASIFEGFGIIAAEVMALQTPLISTVAGGLADIVDDTNAIIIDPEDEKDIANKIKYFANMTKEEKYERTCKAKHKVDALFLAENIVDQLIDVYQKE